MKVAIKTTSGFECTLDDNIANDMELLDALREVDKGNSAVMSDVVALVMGDQKKALYDFCRNEEGRVPIDRIGDVIKEIFESFGNGKK